MILDDLILAMYFFISTININYILINAVCAYMCFFNHMRSLTCETGFRSNVLAFYFNNFSKFSFTQWISRTLLKASLPKSTDYKSILFSSIQRRTSCFYHFCYRDAHIPLFPKWVAGFGLCYLTQD